MNYIRAAEFCAIEEYLRLRDLRKMANSIAVGRRYMLLADIRPGPEITSAFKVPVDVQTYEEWAETFATISVDLLDRDLQAIGLASFLMNADGLIQSTQVREASTNQDVAQMFMIDYEANRGQEVEDGEVENTLGFEATG